MRSEWATNWTMLQGPFSMDKFRRFGELLPPTPLKIWLTGWPISASVTSNTLAGSTTASQRVLGFQDQGSKSSKNWPFKWILHNSLANEFHTWGGFLCDFPSNEKNPNPIGFFQKVWNKNPIWLKNLGITGKSQKKSKKCLKISKIKEKNPYCLKIPKTQVLNFLTGFLKI